MARGAIGLAFTLRGLDDSGAERLPRVTPRWGGRADLLALPLQWPLRGERVLSTPELLLRAVSGKHEHKTSLSKTAEFPRLTHQHNEIHE